MSNHNDDDNHRRRHHNQSDNKPLPWWAVVLVVLWLFLGALAYVRAFQCTKAKYGASDAEKIGMMLLASLLGPLWFLILPFVRPDGYCQVVRK